MVLCLSFQDEMLLTHWKWCMQYFLVLFLIPFPQASSLFLVSFFVFLFLKHRPCLCCSMVIFALLSSTCNYYGDEMTTGNRCWVDLKRDWLFTTRLQNMVYLPISGRPTQQLPAVGNMVEVGEPVLSNATVIV
ncbi:hypothetical protein BJ742DRAFT_792952 [Cladochytrium replicatum]|nr:hypothetical protein BJ742DRAFT_792952 [Cladochytrium replicatum]